MLGELLSKLDPRSAVTLFGLCISVVSFFVDRWNSRAVAKRRREKELRQESRQRELEYLDRQLRCLYGPLFGMVSSSYGIYAAFKASAAQLLALPARLLHERGPGAPLDRRQHHPLHGVPRSASGQ